MIYGIQIYGKSSCHIKLKDVGNLFHLRFLGLAGVGILELPNEIGNLQFLQVLDVRWNPDLEKLPATACKLRGLMVLDIDDRCKCKWLQGGLGNLTSMEVLKTKSASLNIVQELSSLGRLRELEIQFNDESAELEEAFVESICSLHGIQNLVINGNFRSLDFLSQCWAPPGCLRGFDSYTAGGSDVQPRSAGGK